jgi:hypothetical protein
MSVTRERSVVTDASGSTAHARAVTPAYAIMAGTNKSGSSSIFRYLSEHPDVCGSAVKETAFFLREYTDGGAVDRAAYERYFSHCPQGRLRLEASPGYLAAGRAAAERIAAMLPAARVFFVLRHPVERLHSYYRFHREQLRLPADLSFERFVECSHAVARGEPLRLPGVEERHFRALEHGRYATYLAEFMQPLGGSRPNVYYYEHLRDEPVRLMGELCEFLGIDGSRYAEHGFEKMNVTFPARFAFLHRIAIRVDRALERVLRQRPQVKSRLVQLYRRLNRKSDAAAPVAPGLRAELLAYYAESNAALETLCNRPIPDEWHR